MAAPVTARPAARPAARTASAAAAADVVAVAVFVVLGRRSHDEAGTVVGFLGTAAPFLLALAGSWVAVRAWRRPVAMAPTGIVVWVGTVAVGMVLRGTVFGDGTAASFVVVTAAFLGAALLGWRAVAGWVSRRRSAA